MNLLKLCRLVSASVLFTSFFLTQNTWAQGSEEPRFQATANAADTLSPIGGKGVFGVGFYSETLYLLSSPFSSDKGTAGGTRDTMRFQIPLGFGIEGSYGINRSMEAALSVGLDYFKTQNFRSKTGLTKTYDEAKYRLIPIMGIFRYRWPKKFWAPEAEVGLGAAMGSIKITATTLNKESFESSGPFYRAHIAAGTGFVWGEGASLHVQVGYGMNQLGAKVYNYASGGESSGFSVQQEGMMQGVFIKSFLKFYF